MHADCSLRRQRPQQVGDLDPIQNVRVDNCNGPNHQDSPIEAEIFGVTRQLRQGIIGLGSLSITKRDHIEQSNPAVRPHHSIPESAGFELLDQMRPTHVEQIGGLGGGEFGIESGDRHALTGPEMLDDVLQQFDELARYINRVPVGIDQLRPPRSDIFTCQCVPDQCQFAILNCPGPDLSCSCHVLNIPPQPQ